MIKWKSNDFLYANCEQDWTLSEQYNSIKKRLGRNVAMYRRRRGWTRSYFAEKMQISPTFLMHIEHGTRGVSLETLDLLARELQVDIADLFGMQREESKAEDALSKMSEQFEKDLFDTFHKAIIDVIERYNPELRE